MIKKLEILMRQIEDVIEFAYEECMYDDYTDLKDNIEHGEFIKDRITELESQYSMIWRIRIQLGNGTQTSKEDLKYINEVNKQIAYGDF
jgi:hypothetical protein